MNHSTSILFLATFADTFKTVLGVLLALAGLCVALQGVVGAANKSWKNGLTFVLIGSVLLAVGLRLAGAVASSLDNVIGVVLSLAGLVFLGLGVVALPGPTKAQGLAFLGAGAVTIVAGLWIMGTL